jgi:hypothetical protein
MEDNMIMITNMIMFKIMNMALIMIRHHDSYPDSDPSFSLDRYVMQNMTITPLNLVYVETDDDHRFPEIAYNLG